MKKRILLFLLAAGLGSLMISSYDDGPANSGTNRTGAQGSLTTCGGSGCHGTGAGPAVTVTVDSGTAAVTHYVPGMTYNIKLHGAGSTNNYFGFQFASVSGTGTAQVQAGTPLSLPAHVANHSFSGLMFVEHDTILSATSTGVYDIAFQWTAPVTNVGNVTLYCTLNAVNGDDIQNAPDVSGNTSVVLAAESAPASVSSVFSNISITAFPNPVGSSLQLQMNEATEGTYTIQAFTISGQCVTNENIAVSGKTFTAAINTGNWAPGMYSVVVAKDGSSKVIQVVKQ